MSALRTRVYQLNSQLELLVEKYDADNIQLAQAKTDVAQNQALLTQAEQNLAQAEGTMNSRLVEIYERGEAGDFLDVLLGATSWSDLVDRVVFLERISQQDSQSVAQVSTYKKQVADQQVEAQSAAQEATKGGGAGARGKETRDAQARAEPAADEGRSEADSRHGEAVAGRTGQIGR